MVSETISVEAVRRALFREERPVNPNCCKICRAEHEHQQQKVNKILTYAREIEAEMREKEERDGTAVRTKGV